MTLIAQFDEVFAYERASVERCKTALSGKIFYDLGARNGLWTHAAFHAAAKKVIAFEVDGPKCNGMRKRFSEFGDRFEMINAKVGNGLPSTRIAHDRVWTHSELHQPTSIIDIRPNAFVKMDIEGDEIDALNGMQNSIKQVKPDFMIEVHGDAGRKNTIVQMLRDWMGR